jgi:PAS domain S-box-containing protein
VNGALAKVIGNASSPHATNLLYMIKLPEKENGLAEPHRLQKGEAIANILKGYEDFTLDVTGRIISSNLEAVNITGYEEWEAIGKNFSLFYTQGDKEAGIPQQDLEKARLDNKVTFSAWKVKKRNATFWAQVTIKCLRDDEHEVTGYKMTLKDQTHRLISNNRLRKFRNEYLNVFNNPFIGIFKFKVKDFKIILSNDAASKVMGINKDPKRFNEIFRISGEFQTFYDLLMKEEKVDGYEFQLNTEAEVYGRIDCRLFSEEGFVEGVITDVTQNKNQITELKRLNDDLDSFMYHASHDLRSPLTSLLGLINLIEFDKEIELKDYCSMMRERVTYLDDLLKDMASIIYNSKSDVAIEAIDFDEITRWLMHEFPQEVIPIRMSVEVKSKDPFFSDQYRIQTILKHLVANSIRHYNPREAHPYIKIAINSLNGHVVMMFNDNGKGIKDDQLLHLFDMFHKVSDGVKETGLGLYITKLMVDKLQGRICVSSKIGSGTEFKIELPNLNLTSH